MESFEGKIAVVTGGGTGMGRELVCQLISEGAHVATCDVIEENLLETMELAEKKGTGRLTTQLRKNLVCFACVIADTARRAKMIKNNSCARYSVG